METMFHEYLNETDQQQYRMQPLLESYDWSKRQTSYASIFLSHSSYDKEISLPMAITVLERYGADVYIDANDPKLPPRTSVETAKILRSRIKDCQKFIVLVSENSSRSRWIPWELGYADGKKADDYIAIFPYVPTNSTDKWIGQEYLGCYPLIKRYHGTWVVYSKFRENSYINLQAWIKRF